MINSAIRQFSAMTCHLPEATGRRWALAWGMLLSKVWLSERRFLAETIDRVYFRMNRPLPRPVSEIIDRMFMHFALCLFEILRFPKLSPEHLDSVFSFKDFDLVDRAVKAGKGVILTLPHIGNWELLGSAIAYRGYRLHSFFMAQKEDDFGSLLDYFRGFTHITLHDRDRGGLGALKALKKGELLGMIADQDGGNQAIYCSFLGHFVSFPAGPANWSLKTGAAVIPLFALRRGLSRHYSARFLPPLGEVSGKTHEERVLQRATQQIRWMEELILAHPEQYLWFYNRFKPRHEGYISRMKQAGMKMVNPGLTYGLVPPISSPEAG
jgi:KDO2-lipid IV(A) lauroyltransferase